MWYKIWEFLFVSQCISEESQMMEVSPGLEATDQFSELNHLICTTQTRHHSEASDYIITYNTDLNGNVINKQTKEWL